MRLLHHDRHGMRPDLFVRFLANRRQVRAEAIELYEHVDEIPPPLLKNLVILVKIPQARPVGKDAGTGHL